jgi:hypothetical protein
MSHRGVKYLNVSREVDHVTVSDAIGLAAESFLPFRRTNYEAANRNVTERWRGRF